MKKKNLQKQMSDSQKKKLWDRTYTEAVDILNTHGRCVIIRPTGFGKTWILARLMKRFDNILFLYVNEQNMNEVKKAYYHKTNVEVTVATKIPGVTFMTYAKWARLKTQSNRKKHLENIDVIMADECSTLGAKETMSNMENALEEFPDIKLIGATATPDRMDMVDEIGRFFTDMSDIDNPKTLQPFEYGLHEALKDGMLKKPNYRYCNYADLSDNGYNVKKLEKMTLKEMNKLANSDKLEFMKELDSAKIEMKKVYNMPNVIRRTINSCAKSNDYIKFVCFFSTIKDIADKGPQVLKWFKEAYPKHTVSTLEISSRDKDTELNVNELRLLTPKKKHIDLIFACNMLNMSYHVDDLTGIFMYRKTNSLTIYLQQLGRALSSSCANSSIVLDIVDNIHQPPLYRLTKGKSARRKWLESRLDALITKNNLANAFEQAKIMKAASGKIDAKELKDKFNIDKKGVVEIKKAIKEGNGDRFKFTDFDRRELACIIAELNGKRPRTTNNPISPDYFIVLEDETTIEEFMRKVVAQTTSMNARRAYNNWIAAGGCLYNDDGTRKTAKQLKSEKAEDGVIPLPPFCWVKKISEDAVLELMGILDDNTPLSKSNMGNKMSDFSDRLPKETK